MHADEDLLPQSSENNTMKSKENATCNVLWFSGMHELKVLYDPTSELKYNEDYSVALNSATINAKDVFQPVLILGRHGLENQNSTEHSKFGRWAEQKGAKVIYSPKLSFQEDVDHGLSNLFAKKLEPRYYHARLQGPFLRLDIPKLMKEHNLFGLPNVCKNHVIYTDADVIFANKINKDETQGLIKSMGDDVSAMCGRESGKHADIKNTSVMIMNADLFEQDISKMLKHAKRSHSYPEHDQKMLNNWRQNTTVPNNRFKMLPMHYNWKPC